jgi:hypothetical protein
VLAQAKCEFINSQMKEILSGDCSGGNSLLAGDVGTIKIALDSKEPKAIDNDSKSAAKHRMSDI